MKKRWIIIIPVITALLLIAILIVINLNQPPAWKVMLEQYLAFLHSSGGPSYQVVTAQQAAQPAEFSPGMVTASFGDDEKISPPSSFEGDYFSSIDPVPFPPDQVWCVLLADGGRQQLVFVALHNSDYHTDWIVHIPPEPWGSRTLQSDLSTIGCNLD